MILSSRHLLQNPRIIIPVGILLLFVFLGGLSRPSVRSHLPFSGSHRLDDYHVPEREAQISPPEQEKVDVERPPPPPADTHIAPYPQPDEPAEASHPSPHASSGSHPIDDLIKQGGDEVEELMKNDISKADVAEAADIYRNRRRRHPPPGFDLWLKYAKSQDALIVESMFDQIYTDLEPFWSLDPAAMREQALSWPFSISIRNGDARKRAKRLVAGEWLDYWEKMFKQIAQYLPDMDIAVNQIDESRIIVPYEKMAEHMAEAAKSQSTQKPASLFDVTHSYPKRDELSFERDYIGDYGLMPEKKIWTSSARFWDLARKACEPTSAGRKAVQARENGRVPKIQSQFPLSSHEGYVSNWTDARNPCSHADLRHLHGNLVRPRFVSVNTTLFPLFSGCKIQGINNEILLPAAKYFSDEEEFNAAPASVPWEHKKAKLVWRGQATGGAHNEATWKRFHRQRFVAMLNGTFVDAEEGHAKTDVRKKPMLSADIDGTQDPKEAVTPHHEANADSNLQPRDFHPEVKGAFAGIDPPDPEDTDPTTAAKPKQPHNIPVIERSNPYNLSALTLTSNHDSTTLGLYIQNKADVAFDHLMCDPWEWSILGPGDSCPYMDPFYRVKPRLPMSEQYTYKYLPDVDGNSYSGRYRGFLIGSGSLVLKSTIWSEWHDSRLVPWAHFVPFHNSYVDLWGILEYFWGYGTGPGGIGAGGGMDFVKGGMHEGEHLHPELRKVSHDPQARKIAEQGKEWANRVLRREDMLVYVYRLGLEYARVVSEERERMMYVQDLFDADNQKGTVPKPAGAPVPAGGR